jgi:hypothetical protein
MTTRRPFRLHLLSLAAAALTAIVASVSGCQPKEGSEHTCACICYKDTGTEVFLLNQTVSTTKECGNVNGSACSGVVNGKQIDGQFANCGPNPNVCIAFADTIRAAIARASAGGSGSGADGGRGDRTGPAAKSGSGQ